MFEAIQEKINNGQISELTVANTELKSRWDQDHGKRISAIANELKDQQMGYLIIGISDDEKLIHTDSRWLKDQEEKVSNHIRQYLQPTQTTKVQGFEAKTGHQILIIGIQNPGDITTWNHKAYKRVGTQTQEMTPDEKLDLSLRLPGKDFSKRPWSGNITSSLVAQFSQKLVENDHNKDLPENLASLAPSEVLKRMRCEDKMAARILFGDLKVRIAYYDDNGDVIEQRPRFGAFNLLSDDFVAEIQRWTKSKGTILQKGSIAVSNEDPYPIKALRECLANAVAHALYERDDGDIIVDLHPNRITIRNNCDQDVKVFAQEWFSKKSWARNKFLMQLLIEAGFTDELGTGKTRLYSQMMDAGKREPIIEYYDKNNYSCWQITLYNEVNNKSYLELLNRFKKSIDSIEEARLATALILWRHQKWSDIQKKLDEHYRNLARQVINRPESPITVFNDIIIPKRWVISTLDGKDSLAFSSFEKELFKKLFHQFSYFGGRNGRFSTKEAKKIIGLSNTASENTQLSNLFREWREEGLLIQEKRGEWRFLKPPSENLEIITSDLNQES